VQQQDQRRVRSAGGEGVEGQVWRDGDLGQGGHGGDFRRGPALRRWLVRAGGTRTHTTLPFVGFKRPKSMNILLKLLHNFTFTFAAVCKNL